MDSFVVTLNNLDGTIDYPTTIECVWNYSTVAWEVTATIDKPRYCGHIATNFNGFKDLETAAAEIAFETLILPLETNSKGTN